MAHLVNAVAKGMAELVAPHGLIPLEFALLRVFLGEEERTTTQLAQMLPVKMSRISAVVTKMVGQGPDAQAAPVATTGASSCCR